MRTIEQLERWLLFGASWAAFELAENHVTVDFFSCTGELVDRGSSDDPEVLAYVGTLVRRATRDIDERTGALNAAARWARPERARAPRASRAVPSRRSARRRSDCSGARWRCGRYRRGR